MEEKKYYPVFTVNVYFGEWGMEYILVGAEDEEDLINHLKSFVDYKRDAKKIAKEKDTRIIKVQNMFTDKPYKVLDRYAYFE